MGSTTTPVINYSEQKSISTESTFENDTIDLVRLNQILASMVEKIAWQMRKQEKLTSCVTRKNPIFKFRYTYPAEKNTIHIIRPYTDRYSKRTFHRII